MTRQHFIGLIIVLIWYSIVGHNRVGDWTSELNLWSRAIAVSPLKSRVYVNHAKALFGLGREQEAVHDINIAGSLEYQHGEK